MRELFAKWPLPLTRAEARANGLTPRSRTPEKRGPASTHASCVEDDDLRHTRRWTMKAIVVTDQAAGTAGMKLVERPEPQAAINDVVVQVYASGFTWGELTWPSTWTDRLGRDRTPAIPGHELAGVVSGLGYGTTGLSVGQR